MEQLLRLPKQLWSLSSGKFESKYLDSVRIEFSNTKVAWYTIVESCKIKIFHLSNFLTFSSNRSLKCVRNEISVQNMQGNH